MKQCTFARTRRFHLQGGSLPPMEWRQEVPAKRWYPSIKSHGPILPNTVILTVTAGRTLNLEWRGSNLEERGISYTRLTPYRVVQQ
jgi:hypothetical protein